MNIFSGRWIILLSILLGFLPASIRQRPLQVDDISMVDPASCPSGGCAAGQRLNMEVDFNSSVSNNYFLICYYFPTVWNVNSFEADTTSTRIFPYNFSPDPGTCPSVPTYSYLGRSSNPTSIPPPYQDGLGFTFSTDKATSKGTNFIDIKVFESNDGSTWTAHPDTSIPLKIVQAKSPSYVAVDSAGCGSHSPCYVNSGDDKPNGVGTGLRDAVIAVPSSSTSIINVLGSYLIKSEKVVIDNPQITINGNADSQITSSGDVANCDNPMLDLNKQATLQNLKIDGSCSSSNRDLILVTNASGVSGIASNDLTNGKNAITVDGSANRPSVELNQISGNSGFAIDSSNGSGNLLAAANNIYNNNGNNKQIKCHTGDQVDHNFWGNGVSLGTAADGCSGDEKKRLGAEIIHNNNAPGVNAVKISVDENKQSFGSQISVQGSSGSNFPLYIVNHGSGGVNNIPFSPQNPILSACSNYWDIFTAPGATVSPFDLYFKFTQNPTCRDIINASKACDSNSAMSIKPIRWYNTANSKWGDMAWSCAGNYEAKASINASDAPKINDFAFLPMVVGLQYYDDSMVNLNSISATGSFKDVIVKWKTSSETHIYGYYVQRSTDDTTGFTRVSDLQAPLGGGGGDYSVTDSSVVNGTTYYYRLEVIYSDLNSYVSSVIEVAPMINTITPTSTPTKTSTPTRTITYTITPYKSITSSYKSPTTYYYNNSYTKTPTRTQISYGVPTKSATPGKSRTPTPTPGALTQTLIAKTPSATPNPFADTPTLPSADELSFVDQSALATQLFQITVASTEDALTATSISEMLTQTPAPAADVFDLTTETPSPILQMPSIVSKIASVFSVISGGLMGLILIAIIVLFVFRRHFRNS